MYTQLAFLALFGAVLVNAASPTKESGPIRGAIDGPCPSFPGKPNFDKKRAEGSWFAVEKTPFDGTVPSCVKAICTSNPDGTSVFSVSFNKAGEAKRRNKTASISLVAGTQSSYKLTPIRVEGEAQDDHEENVKEKFITVLDTDYDNYSFDVLCKSIGTNQHKLAGALWSRKQTLTPEHITKAKQLFKNNNINVEMANVSHDNCKYD